ncbi:MAG: hypothetical protein ACXABO_09120 [Promethearchaeota archaeon]|jgi:hypothetical protein
MEKSKSLGLEKTTILSSSKVKPNHSKEKIVDKIESLWENTPPNGKFSKNENKKLSIKLETTGKERRKISLKLESSSSSIHSSNYVLLSELLKDFFKVNNSKN